ncbi:MFS transporter [Streptomyces sp. NPDC059740]|uniref:MFS transporter n=1 Tax=Streptomyces sp. NPDC059740 TaxID=3346926 RepID=UPI00365D18E3
MEAPPASGVPVPAQADAEAEARAEAAAADARSATAVGRLRWVAAVENVDYHVAAPILPAIAYSLHTDLATVTYSVSIYTLGYGLALPVWGRLVDRHGPRRVLAGGLLLAAAAGAGSAVAPGTTPWLLSRAFAGAGFAAVTPSISAYLQAATSSATRQRGFAILLAATSVSAVLTPLLAGAAAAWDKWRAAFAMVAVLTVLAARHARGLPDLHSPVRRRPGAGRAHAAGRRRRLLGRVRVRIPARLRPARPASRAPAHARPRPAHPAESAAVRGAAPPPRVTTVRSGPAHARTAARTPTHARTGAPSRAAAAHPGTSTGPQARTANTRQGPGATHHGPPARGLRPTRRRGRQAGPSHARRRGDRPRPGLGETPLVRAPGFWAVLALGCAEGAVMIGLPSLLAPALSARGLDRAVAPVMAAYGLSILVGAVLVRRQARSTSARGLLLVGGHLGIAAALVGAVRLHLPTFLVSSVLLGAAWSYLHTTLQTWVPQLLPAEIRATTASLFATSGILSSAAAVGVAAPLIQLGWQEQVFCVAAVVCAGLTVMAAVIGSRWR